MFDFSLVIFTRLCYSFYIEHSFFFILTERMIHFPLITMSNP